MQGQAEEGARIAGVAGVAPRLAVGRELRGEFVQAVAAKADEDGKPRGADPREGLPAGRGHAKRRVRLLPRARAEQRIAHPVKLALEAEPPPLPRPAHDLEALVEPALALRVGNGVALVEPGEPASPDPEVDPPAAHVVEGRDLLRDAERMVEREHVHREADPDAAGTARDRGRQGDRRREHRAVGHEVKLREPGRIEAPRIRRFGEGEALPERVRLAAARAGRELHEHAELHEVPLIVPRSGRPRADRAYPLTAVMMLLPSPTGKRSTLRKPAAASHSRCSASVYARPSS